MDYGVSNPSKQKCWNYFKTKKLINLLTEMILFFLPSLQDLNIENLSVCSWEAVEDRSGPSSGANSATNDLWVPDHAVSSCMGCHTEFWLGRRKHHCR